MLKRFVKNDKHLERLRKYMYFVIVLFICFFFYDIHVQSVNIVEKERYDNDNQIKVSLDYTQNVNGGFSYYGQYVRKIAYDIVQVVFLVMLMLELRINELIKCGKPKKN